MRNRIPFPAASYVRHLARLERRGFHNPWAGGSDTDDVRRARLVDHLRCPCPNFLLITEFARDIDAGTTGIPLVSEYAALNGMVPSARRIRSPSSPHAKLDMLSSEIWRGLNMLEVADQVLCFSAIPLVPMDKPVRDESAYIELFKWVRAIHEWYPHMCSITIGLRTHQVAEAMGLHHKAITQPEPGAGLVEQLVNIVQASQAEARVVRSSGAMASR